MAQKRMNFELTKPQARFFAGLFTNLAAAWFTLAFIAPGFKGNIVTLTGSVLYGIVYSWLAIKCEDYIFEYD